MERHLSKSSLKYDSNLYYRSATLFDPEASYNSARTQAEWYIQTIQSLAKDQNTFGVLQRDLQEWLSSNNGIGPDKKLIAACQNGEISSLSMLSRLKARNQLKQYLAKTVTYLFIRDLGLSPEEPETRRLINSTVSSLSQYVDKHHQADATGNLHDWLKELLCKYQLTQTYQWLRLRLAAVNQFFSDEQSRLEGMRKLVKVIAGILMHQMIENEHQRDPRVLSDTIKLGYAYGLTYPFVDDLLDSNAYLSEKDKDIFNGLLRETLISGLVPEFPEFESSEPKLMLIYQELKWAFEYIHEQLEPQHRQQFLEQAYIFFEAQAEDRTRRLSETTGLDVEELFKPVILKSAGCRIISRDLVNAEVDGHFDYRMFCFGIYNQFNDDIKDIFEDIHEDNLTPYSYFLAGVSKGQVQENPYHYYWAVVYYLIYEVYKDNDQVKQLLLERSINAHKSLLDIVGENTYQVLQKDMLNTPSKAFNGVLQEIIDNSVQVAWFDKVVSQEVAGYFKAQQTRKEEFIDRYNDYMHEINEHLAISHTSSHYDGKVLDVANYALQAGGKRIRPVIALCIGRELYGFSKEQAVKVGSIMEYMHTASLVMDDLPAQDNANLRRGQPTAHKQYNSVAAAELSVVYLMMHAVQAQAGLDDFSAQAILASLEYAAATTKLICEGQLMDLESHHKVMTIKRLEQICHTKTGLALEASMVIPAILAERDELHITKLKALARHMGLIFQIRDDLLDMNGHCALLGKDAGIDATNQRVNFVTLYGELKAQDIMFEHHAAARVIVQQLPEIEPFFSALLDLMIYRLH
jgi:geranylgeranyl pyrophosphate synthase